MLRTNVYRNVKMLPSKADYSSGYKTNDQYCLSHTLLP